MKRALKAILLNESRLLDEVLATLFCEVREYSKWPTVDKVKCRCK